MKRALPLALALAAAAPVAAHAQGEAPPAGPPAGPADPPAITEPADPEQEQEQEKQPAEGKDGEEAGKKAKPRDWTLDLEARVFVRDTLSRVELGDDSAWRHDRTLDQGRVSATYDHGILRLALEVELVGGAELKDTYIRLTPIDALRIRAGRFKVPMSFIWNESKWSLPSVERGVLGELEQDNRGLPFGGIRGEAVSAELRLPVLLEPRFTLALFHNPLNASGTPLDPSEEVTQDLYGRVELEPGPGWLDVAASFGLVGYTAEVSAIDSYEHKPMAGVELKVSTDYLRAWLEGFVGESFLYQADGSTSGTFAAARALVAPRVRQPAAWLWRIDPYLLGSVLDPTGDETGDRISEVAGGVSFGFSKEWRLQLEVAERIAEGAMAALADGTVIRLQLGAAISETIE